MNNRKTVYTYGVFDLFHPGHLRLLKEVAELGDRVVVGLFTDTVAEGFKRKPIMSQEHRRELLEALPFIDEVVYQEEFEPDNLLLKIRPHLIAKGPGAGWTGDSSPCDAVAREIGAEVIVLPYHEGISTSDIIKKIKQS